MLRGVAPPTLKKQAVLWLVGAVVVAILTVAAAVSLLPEFDVLARSYPVL